MEKIVKAFGLRIAFCSNVTQFVLCDYIPGFILNSTSVAKCGLTAEPHVMMLGLPAEGRFVTGVGMGIAHR